MSVANEVSMIVQILFLKIWTQNQYLILLAESGREKDFNHKRQS